MKDKIIIISLVFVLMVSAILASGASTITLSASRLERGLNGIGAMKTATITQTRPLDVNDVPTDANTFSGQQSFTGKVGQTYIINGYLEGVFLKATGTDANGVNLTLKTHTYEIQLFAATEITNGKFYALDYKPVDANNGPYVGVPVDDVVDANWSGNDYNDITIGILWRSNRE